MLDLSVITNNIPLFLIGIRVTLELTAIGMIGGLLLGAPLAVGRSSKNQMMSSVSWLMIEIIRGIPVIMIIFWIYFLVPIMLKGGIPAYASCAVALVLFNTSYSAEIVRAGIRSVSPGNLEAGRATGMNAYQINRYVVLPQAFSNMVPALITQLVMLYKTTSVVYVVGVMDIFRAATIVNNRELKSLEIYLFVGLVYLIPSTLLSHWAKHSEKKRSLATGRA